MIADTVVAHYAPLSCVSSRRFAVIVNPCRRRSPAIYNTLAFSFIFSSIVVVFVWFLFSFLSLRGLPARAIFTYAISLESFVCQVYTHTHTHVLSAKSYHISMPLSRRSARRCSFFYCCSEEGSEENQLSSVSDTSCLLST